MKRAKWIVVCLLASACSGNGHAAPKATPTTTPLEAVNSQLLIGAATAISGVTAEIDRFDAGLSGCGPPTYRCQLGIAKASAAASVLVKRLNSNETLDDPSKTIPVGLSAELDTTRLDADTMRASAASISDRSPARQIRAAVSQIDALTADVDQWRSGGSAATALATLHIQPPPAPQAKLAVKLYVRPLIRIKLGTDGFPNFATTGKHCKGANGLDDIKVGGDVTIYDAAGRRVIGTGYIVKSLAANGVCQMVAAVHGLPPEHFYQVEIGRHGKLAFTEKVLLTEASSTEFGG